MNHSVQIDSLARQEFEELIEKILQRNLSQLGGFSGASNAKQYLTRREAAELMGLSERQVDNLRRAGKLPFLKRGKRVLLRGQDIQSYLMAGFIDHKVKG